MRGVVGVALPITRDQARSGIRNMTIAPGRLRHADAVHHVIGHEGRGRIRRQRAFAASRRVRRPTTPGRASIQIVGN
jgi:hypothetical protein